MLKEGIILKNFFQYFGYGVGVGCGITIAFITLQIFVIPLMTHFFGESLEKQEMKKNGHTEKFFSGEPYVACFL